MRSSIPAPLRRVTILAAMAAALMVPAGIAPATTVKPMNIVETVQNTGQAFAGTVASVEVVQAHGRWAEEITVAVTDPIFGLDDSATTVTWRQVRLAEDLRLPSMPEFHPGQDIAVFLYNAADGSPFRAPVGLDQGAYRLVRDPKSGQLIARNGHANRTLTNGLDVEKLATAARKAFGASAPVIGDSSTVSYESLKATARLLKSQNATVGAFAAEGTDGTAKSSTFARPARLFAE
ncbi:MAG: hypothetical protein RLY93_14610 [Sumerlaeia bacterium]